MRNTYTKSQVDPNITNAMNSLVNGIPDALNTLKELADPLNDDSNFASHLVTPLSGKLEKTYKRRTKRNGVTN